MSLSELAESKGELETRAEDLQRSLDEEQNRLGEIEKHLKKQLTQKEASLEDLQKKYDVLSRSQTEEISRMRMQGDDLRDQDKLKIEELESKSKSATQELRNLKSNYEKDMAISSQKIEQFSQETKDQQKLIARLKDDHRRTIEEMQSKEQQSQLGEAEAKEKLSEFK